jgi:hypothetical protein
MEKFNWLLVLIIALISCNKEKEFDYPLVYTGEVTDIKNDGALFSGNIVDLSKLEIIDYGFVWDNKTNPTIENAEKYVINGPPRIGVYSQHISTTLKDGVKYYVRTYVRNSKYITYGQEVVFTSLGSLAPQILDFMPKTGNLRDTLTITGHNFSYKLLNNKVQIGEFETTVIKANQDTLIVIVPDKLNKLSSSISVTIQGNKATSSGSFNLIPPVLSDFHDKTGTFGSQVTIVGENFLANPTSVQVYFDSIKANIVDIQSQNIIVLVPDSLDNRQSNIKVRMNNLTVSSIDKFQLAPLSINDFTPKVSITGNTITLTGNNYSPIPKNNIVTIGELKATVTKASVDELEVTLPLQDIGYYSSRDAKVNVEVLGENHDFNETILINDKWFRRKDSPIDFSDSFYAVANNKAYLGINGSQGFWEYDPVNDEFKKLTDFPGSARNGGNGFVINNKIYFGTGNGNYINLKDFWEYNISSGLWIQKSDFAGQERVGSITFSTNGNGYLGGGIYYESFVCNHPFDDFWKYNAINDTWSRIPSFMEKDSSSVYGITSGISVVEGSLAYIGLGWNNTSSPPGEDGQDQRWFVYNALTNSWNQLAYFPKSRNFQNAIAFNLNGVPYVKTVASDFYFFDSSSNFWQIVATGLLPNDISGIGFSIENIAYIGIGRALWEYDPSR